MSIQMIHRRRQQFLTGQTSTGDELCSGRPLYTITQDPTNIVHSVETDWL